MPGATTLNRFLLREIDRTAHVRQETIDESANYTTEAVKVFSQPHATHTNIHMTPNVYQLFRNSK